MQNTDRSWTEIHLDRFEYNVRALCSMLLPGTKFLQIVKADAYGHGAFDIAKRAIKLGASYLGVANAEEGALLRYQGIDEPILVLSPPLPSEIELLINSNLTPAVSDLLFAKALNEAAAHKNIVVKAHIKIDTGMHRSGFLTNDFPYIWNALSQLKHIEWEGIFSHFAASENDPTFTATQASLFKKLLDHTPHQFTYTHIANSSGLIRKQYSFTNMVRLGLLSYGIYADQEAKTLVDLKAVMTFKSQITQIKNINAGETIGYNRTYQADKNMQYAIIPVGYADGYDYLLGNNAPVLIENQLCPVVGKVSMDMITVDVSSLKAPYVGQEVCLLGDNHELIRAESLANNYRGNSYELLCQIGRRAKRYYFDKDVMIASSPLSRREFVSSDFNDRKLNHIIESAISQRLQSKEIANLIYEDILRKFFFNKDKEIHYRKNFYHTISLENEPMMPGYWLTTTKLSFTKVLQQPHFLVACATDEASLQNYFMRRDVEYRWLLDKHISLGTNSFNITEVSVNQIPLTVITQEVCDCLEINCSHPTLQELVGQEVEISISTRTYYPKQLHHLTIYITELTHGVTVEFNYPEELSHVQAVSIVAGQNKFPYEKKSDKHILVASEKEEWIFPNSGIVFVY